jgi:dTDP-4-amino-4,6-dideoxygalactose transaminase
LFKSIPRFKVSLTNKELHLLLKGIFRRRHGSSDDRIVEFEKRFAEYIGVNHAIMVPSARMGLYLSLKNLGLNPGDEIILPSFTHYAVPSMILYLGLKPIFVDIDPQTYNLNPNLVKKLITPNTKAIIPTHLYGLPCDMDAILEITKRYNLKVIEDCAQACGAEYKGKKTGSIGDVAYFSLGLTKNITALGIGVVTTDDYELACRIRSEVNSYSPLPRLKLIKRIAEAFLIKVLTTPIIFSIFLFPLITLFIWWFDNDIVGDIFKEEEILFTELPKEYLKSRPVELQAEIGISQMERIEKINQERIENAQILIDTLNGFDKIKIPKLLPYAKQIFVSFPIQAKNRKRLQRELLGKGVDTSSGFIRTCSRMNIFNKFKMDCPISEEIEQNILHLPVYPSLSKKDLLYISESIIRILKKDK